jgi:hypothetical protein
MKHLFTLFLVGIWKLKEINNNFIINILDNGRIFGFHENDNKNIKGYWEENNLELAIFTNESKIYHGQFVNNNLTKLNGCVTYGFDSPDYLYNFELIPIYRIKSTKQALVARVLKHSSSFLGTWLFERKILTTTSSIKKIKINNKYYFVKINNNQFLESPIINLIKLNDNGTWSYGTIQGQFHLAGRWNLYNTTFEGNVNYNTAYRKNSSGENIWLKNDRGNVYFLGTNLTSNNITIHKVSGHVIFGSDYDNDFYITRWFN